MVIPGVIALVGGLVGLAYLGARAETRAKAQEQDAEAEARFAQLQEERAYREAQAEEERAYREAREAAQRDEDRRLKLEDRDEGRVYDAAKLAEGRAYAEGREPHAGAVYLVPYYAQLVGVSKMWSLKALPVPAQLTLEVVRADGLQFVGVSGVVPFDHVEDVEDVVP